MSKTRNDDSSSPVLPLGRGPLSSALCGSLALLAAVASVSGCRTRDFGEGDKSDVNKAFDPAVSRGRKTVRYSSPGGTQEVCVLPKRFPGVKYPKGDDKDEEALCGLNFYKTGTDTASPGEGVALCPKLSSTFPGVEPYALEGRDKASYESTLCRNEDRPTKRLAKFKQSVSCSFTGSILGYYHLSRILGDAGNVPVAVLRTMDVRQHKKVADRGVAFSAPGELNNQLWKQVQGMDASPRERRNYFTPDLKNVFGALSDNPSDEERYAEINANSADGARARDIFFGKAEVARVFTAGGVGALVKRDFASAAPGIQQMKDISDMILMDHLFQQQDRFGNIHFQDYWYFVDEKGEIDSKKIKKSGGTPETPKPAPTAVKVKRMLMKDNDCGSRAGHPKAFTLDDLRRMRHMSAKTYKRLQYLAAQFRSGAADTFFREEALLETDDALGGENGLKGLKARTLAAADTLKAQCKAGSLLLDLSIEDHVASTNLPEMVKARCDEIHTPEAGSDGGGSGSGATGGSGTGGSGAPISGKAIASKDTYLKKSAAGSDALKPEEKCLVTSGVTVGYSSSTQVGQHAELTVDNAPSPEASGCPASFFTTPVFVFREHFNFVEPRTCVVAADSANVRADSNTDAAILKALPKGTRFNVEGRKDRWYATMVDGKLAYVSPVTLEEPCRSL